jgi:PAS domain S-box-containing protein
MSQEPQPTVPRILVVEDEYVIAADLVARLERLGYANVAHAADGEAGIQSALKEKPDLVLMDIHLGQALDGIAAAEIIRSRIGSPVVFLTAYADEERLKRAQLTQPFGYLLKPFQDRDLHVAIEMALYASRMESERRRAEDLMRIQRDLGAAFSSQTSLAEVLDTALDTVTRIDPIDRAGLYLRDPGTGEFLLAGQRGLSENFARDARSYPAESKQVRFIMAGQPVFQAYSQLEAANPELIQQAGLRAIGVIPLAHDGQVIASLNVASSRSDEITPYAQHALVSMAHLLAGVIARLRTQEALRASEGRYRRLFEDAVLGIFRTSPKGRIMEVNPAFARMFGYDSPADLVADIGDHVERLYADPNIRNQAVYETVHEGGRLGTETWGRRRDGTVFPGKRYSWAVRDDSGRVIHLEGFVEDITERKQYENVLLENEKRHRQILDAIPDPVLVYDRDGRVTYMNQTAVETYGYHPDEVLGTRFLTFIPPEERVASWTAWEQTRAGSSIFLDTRRMTKDGHPLDVQLKTAALIDGRGDFKEGIVLHRNVTQLKKTEAALISSEERYRSILAGIQEGYYEVDLAGNITFLNQALVRILGCHDPKEVIGLNNRTFMDEEMAKTVYRAFNEVYTIGRPNLGFHWTLRRRDGAVCPVEASVDLLRDAKGHPYGFRGVIRDVTELAKAQEEKNRRERFQGALATAGAACHELNQPLQTVLGLTELALLTLPVDDPNRDHMERILEQARRMAGITQRLKSITRFEAKPYVGDTTILDLEKASAKKPEMD